MEISNVESVALPIDLQKKMDAARNNLTLMEQECNRLNELKSEQELRIKETLQSIADLNAKLTDVSAKYSAVVNEAKDRLAKLSNFLKDF